MRNMCHETETQFPQQGSSDSCFSVRNFHQHCCARESPAWSPDCGKSAELRIWNLAFHLQIDGRSVANIVQGHRYDGWVPAGRHVLTVYKVPYVGYAEPTSRTVNVQPGWTYVFTAMWD